MEGERGRVAQLTHDLLRGLAGQLLHAPLAKRPVAQAVDAPQRGSQPGAAVSLAQRSVEACAEGIAQELIAERREGVPLLRGGHEPGAGERLGGRRMISGGLGGPPGREDLGGDPATPAQAQKKVVAMVNKGQAKTVRRAHRVLQGRASFDNTKGRADGLHNLHRILKLAASGPVWEGVAGGEAARLLSRYEGASDAIRHALTSALDLLSTKDSSAKKARTKTRRTDGTSSSPHKDQRSASLSNLPLFEGAP